MCSEPSSLTVSGVAPHSPGRSAERGIQEYWTDGYYWVSRFRNRLMGKLATCRHRGTAGRFSWERELRAVHREETAQADCQVAMLFGRQCDTFVSHFSLSLAQMVGRCRSGLPKAWPRKTRRPLPP